MRKGVKRGEKTYLKKEGSKCVLKRGEKTKGGGRRGNRRFPYL
jgi:hypothetical protein